MCKNELDPTAESFLEGPKLYFSCDVAKERLSGSPQEVYASKDSLIEHLAETLPESDLKSAFQAAIPEIATRRDQHAHQFQDRALTPEANKFKFRCLKRSASDTIGLAQVYENVHALGVEDNRVEERNFSIGMPLYPWLFPRKSELEQGQDVTVILVYKDDSPPDTSGVATSAEVSDSLRDSYIGAVQINWI